MKPVLSEAERALEAAQGSANLRQFDLAARTRGTRQLSELARRVRALGADVEGAGGFRRRLDELG